MGEAPPQTAAPRLGRRRKLAFALVAGLLALAAAELTARLVETALAATTGETSAYVDFVNPVPLFERASVDGREVWRRTAHQPLVVRHQSFAANKPPGGLRIFLVGGSAASGWPHHEKHDGYTITALLARKLRMLYPDRPIEVINAAGSTYASHRVRFVVEEIVRYEPDLVLIYNGNNEFLERFVFRPRLPPEPWRRSAVARTLWAAVGRLLTRPRRTVDVASYSLADQASNRISYAFGQASRYRQDPDQYRELLAHYRDNIRAMVRTCRERGVGVLLLNVPVNLKDWIPNASVHRRGLEAKERDRWQERFRTGFLALEAGQPERAVAPLAEAVAIDDEHAEGHYWLAVALHRTGRIERAREEYLRALERDAFPFRELPDFRRELETIAREERVPLVDSIGVVERLATDGIPGLDVLVDYVHLRGSSQEAIAHAVLEAMAAAGMLAAPRAVELAATRIEVPKLFDDMATDYGLVSMYRQLLVMRQYDKLDETYRRMVGVLREIVLGGGAAAEDAMRQLQIAERIQEVIVPYRRLLRAEKLGTLEQEFSEEEARSIYQDYLRMVRFTEGQDLSEEEFRRVVPELEYRKVRPAGR